jgi:hypothetical protein
MVSDMIRSSPLLAATWLLLACVFQALAAGWCVFHARYGIAIAAVLAIGMYLPLIWHLNPPPEPETAAWDWDGNCDEIRQANRRRDAVTWACHLCGPGPLAASLFIAPWVILVMVVIALSANADHYQYRGKVPAR